MAPKDVVHGLLEQEDRRMHVRGWFDVRARFACSLQVGRESLPLRVGNTFEFDNWDGHATVLHGDGVEFGAYGPGLRSVVMYVWK